MSHYSNCCKMYDIFWSKICQDKFILNNVPRNSKFIQKSQETTRKILLV